MRRGWMWLALPLVLGLLGVERPRGLGDVVEVRHWSYPDYTRVVVEFDRPVDSRVHHLPADRSAKRPERLYLDVDGIWVGRRYVDGVAVGDGLLRAVRLGQNTLTTTRVVIDVEHYQRHRLLRLTHPDRLVVDVYGPRNGEGTRPADGRRLSSRLRPVHTIVVDAGHGGRDPGAIGVGRMQEKQVTLRLAKALGKQLRARGFQVVYTREDDRSIGLEERTAIAEAAQGDLFVSLHANAAKRRSIRGIETYYPADDHARHSLGLAARENGIDRSQVDALQKTLASLRVSETSLSSQRLATLVQEQLVDGIGGTYGPVTNLGVKKGPFYVLFLSNMPAILVEAGFLTNREEAKRLRDGEYLDAVATQIARGLQNYSEGRTEVALGNDK